MAEQNKKSSGGVRKFFFNLFCIKNKNKETMNITGDTANNNETSRSLINSDNHEPQDNEGIYEKLPTSRNNDSARSISTIQSTSDHSSSSTLESDSVSTRSQTSEVASDSGYTNYADMAQVPLNPQNKLHPTNIYCDMSRQLNVYYHSVENLTDKISPLDEVSIYRASRSQADPASVGAEIKKVSTKFLISPKKEAEVRTIQPTRARSLLFDNNENTTEAQRLNVSKTTSKRAYNYSAPTSPMPISNPIPSLPKTLSSHERVRKTTIEAEEKRTNSTNRSNLRIKSTPLPPREHVQRSYAASPMTTISKDPSRTMDKEKMRKNVEAFNWQKLKEMKDEEDTYMYMRHSLNSSLQISKWQSDNSIRDLQNHNNQAVYSSFLRGAPERRTDTCLKSRTPVSYQQPEMICPMLSIRTKRQMPIFLNSSPPTDTSSLGQPKHVSFEEDNLSDVKIVDPEISSANGVGRANRECPKQKVEVSIRGPPPLPPRTTGSGFKVPGNNTLINAAGRRIYSEFESGSEAGEIQRILQNDALRARKKKRPPRDSRSAVHRSARHSMGVHCFV